MAFVTVFQRRPRSRLPVPVVLAMSLTFPSTAKHRLVDEWKLVFEPAMPSRIAAFDGLRAVAIILVFFVHFNAIFGGGVRQGSLVRSLLQCAANGGHSGVELFFLISGYLIYGIVLRPRFAYFPFVWRRILRIYPTFLAVFAVYVAISCLNPSISKIPAGAGPALIFLAQNILFMPGLFPTVALITVAWTLSYEFAFYLSTPLVVYGLGMAKWTPLNRIAALIAIGFLLMQSPHFRLMALCSGALLYEVNALGISGSALGEKVAMLVAAATLVFACSSPVADLNRTKEFIVVGGFFLAGRYVLFEGGAIQSFLSMPLLRWLGNISYSFYLAHGLALHALAAIWKPVNAGPLLTLFTLLLSFAFALALSLVLFLLVERPSLRMGKKRTQSRECARLSALSAQTSPRPLQR